MKYLQKITREVEAKTLRCEMGVRYWEDAVVNGEPEDNDAPKMPFGANGIWKIDIDLDTGVIANWPKGTTASTHYKVCDDGVYTLLDADGNVLAKRDNYVPSMLAPTDEGYGDYVILDIDIGGLIAGWKADLRNFDGEE